MMTMLARKRRHAFLALLLVGTCFYFLLEYLNLSTCPVGHRRPQMEAAAAAVDTDFQRWLAKQLNVSVPPRALVNTRWQAVVRNETYVLSAFYDPRPKLHGAVRITAISSLYSHWFQSALYCQLWYNNNTVGSDYGLFTVRAQTEVIKETHNRRFGPELLTCYLPDNRVPDFVCVRAAGYDKPADNLLPVHTSDRQPTHAFTVCTAPLIHGYNNVYQLVEFIESNRLFGADYFVLYDYQSGPALYPYLSAYIEDGLVQVVQWPAMPVYTADDGDVPPPEIHNYGQVAALVDCLYRHLTDSQYIAYIDLDEMIVPRRAQTWSALVSAAGRRSTFWDSLRRYLAFLPRQRYGAFSFRNKFFFASPQLGGGLHSALPADSVTWYNVSPDDASLIRRYKIRCLSVTTASRVVYPHGVRSKYIMSPLDVVLPGIHFVFEFYDIFTRMFTFAPEEAMLNHYRHVTSRAEIEQDPSALTYLNRLLPRIVQRHRNVEKYMNCSTCSVN